MIALLAMSLTSCNKNRDRKVYGCIVNDSTNAPIPSKTFYISYSYYKGPAILGYNAFRSDRFKTDGNGCFDKTINALEGTIYLSRNAFDDYQEEQANSVAFWKKDIGKKERNIYAGTVIAH